MSLEMIASIPAMCETYGAVSTRKKARDKLLRLAFVSQLARDTHDNGLWDDINILEEGLDKYTDFCKDYTLIMCRIPDGDDNDPRTEGPRIEDLLVSEVVK
jgi:hypothetical protein